MMSTESQNALKAKLKLAIIEREMAIELEKIYQINRPMANELSMDMIEYGICKYKISDGKLVRIHPMQE